MLPCADTVKRLRSMYVNSWYALQQHRQMQRACILPQILVPLEGSPPLSQIHSVGPEGWRDRCAGAPGIPGIKSHDQSKYWQGR